MGRMYSVIFSDVAVTAAQDLFQIQAATGEIVKLHQCIISQSSDVGDAASEALLIEVRRFTDAMTDDVNAVALDPGDPADTSLLAINETVQLVTGQEVIHAEAWNVLTPWIYLPPPELRASPSNGNGIAIALDGTPADSLTMSGTLYFEVIGG